MNIFNRQFFLAASALIIIVTTVYGQSLLFEFINFDDDAYIVDNPQVNSGLSWSNIYWAFTESHSSNWHPLTWLSHMLDVNIFGLSAGGHHATNLLFHLANSVLLLAFFRLAGIDFWPSATMSALFAVHPMHVESVAWIAERKDVLSTFFMLLTLIAYIYFVRRQTLTAYGFVLLFCALGLMSKTMLVTLPAVLLLLDYYPLKRINLRASGHLDLAGLMQQLKPLLIEKIPLVLLAVGAALIAYQTQQGAMITGASLSLDERIINALVAYSHYFSKALLPGELAVFYPHPAQWPLLDASLAVILLTAATATAVWHIRTRPYMIVGWLWFLGTLVPVIGIVQIGNQYMADRYTYIPFIGLFLALVPWVYELMLTQIRGRDYFVASSVLVVLVFSISTAQYLSHWRDAITLFRHTLRVTDPNYEYFLGAATDPVDDSKPLAGLWTSYYNMGNALAAKGYFPQALRHLDLATQLAPQLVKAHNNKALVLAALGRKQEAVDLLEQVLKRQPDYEQARINLENFRKAWQINDLSNTDS